MTETRVTWASEGKSYDPDVNANRLERVPLDPQGFVTNHVTLQPHIAVEIWLPGQILGDQMDRCRWYVAHDVPVALLVHPERRRVWTIRSGSDSGPLSGTDVVDLSDLSEGLSFTVDELFDELRGRRARARES
jgi:Uma2 family endonuclease